MKKNGCQEKISVNVKHKVRAPTPTDMLCPLNAGIVGDLNKIGKALDCAFLKVLLRS